MNSKEYLANEAERLYVYDYNTVDEIASKMKISAKTVCRWKEKFEWEVKRKSYLKSKQSFHEEMYEFARKMMKDITTDMENGEKVDTGRFHAFCRLIPMFVKAKDYEDIVAKKEIPQAKPRGLTDDIVAEIEENILGLVPNDRNENNEEE